MLDIKRYEEQIRKICIELQLNRLDLFGSGTTDNFGPNSDLDIIVDGTIKNPYLKENISQTRKNIYAS